MPGLFKDKIPEDIILILNQLSSDKWIIVEITEEVLNDMNASGAGSLEQRDTMQVLLKQERAFSRFAELLQELGNKPQYAILKKYHDLLSKLKTLTGFRSLPEPITSKVNALTADKGKASLKSYIDIIKQLRVEITKYLPTLN